MMRLQLLLLVAVFGMTLGACTPNTLVYFKPTVAGGITKKARCIPVDSRVEFLVGTLPVTAQAQTVRGERFVSLFLRPLSGQTVRFLSDQFQVTDMDTKTSVPILRISTFRDDQEKSLLTEYQARVKADRLFNILIYLPEKGIDSFELSTPSLLIDDKPIAFPTIHFQRETWVGISPLNC